MNWYERAFQADYLRRYAHRSGEAAREELPFLHAALALPRGARVLDLCCGAGRHSRALADMGYRVTGLDLSFDLLTAAHRASPSGIDFLRADMRRLPFAADRFDGVANLFTSFGYFMDDRENAGVLAEVSRVLRPGGRFVQDFFNLVPTLAGLVPQSERDVDGVRLVERRFHDTDARRLVKESRADTGEVIVESVRAYSPEELLALAESAGLSVSGHYGDLRGAPFDPERSPRCVIVAEKRT